MIRYVSVDVVFLTNFLIDLVWLWVTGRLAGLKVGRWRVAVAAGVGGLLAVWAHFPSGVWLRSLPGAVAGTLLTLGAAFAPCSLRQAGRAVSYFLLSGAAMAGTVLILARPGAALSAGTLPTSVAGGMVVAGVAVGAVGVGYLWQSGRRRTQLQGGLWAIRVTLGNTSVTLPALVDTGNHLRDPLMGTPVVVADCAALRPLLPGEIYRIVAAGWQGLERLPDEWTARCRLVPFRAVGQPEGMLLALAPDALAVQPPAGGDWQVVTGLVGLSTSPLHPEGVYRALLPGQLALDER